MQAFVLDASGAALAEVSRGLQHLLLLLAYAFSCANGTGDRDSCEFGQLVRSFAGAPDG